MKRLTILLLVLCAGLEAGAQKYSFTFKPEGISDTVMFVARHFRDQLQLMDTAAKGKDGSFCFKGKREWPRGMYALVRQGGEKALCDFVIDDSRQFTITGDERLTPATVKVKGSEGNRQMFDYLATVAKAKKEMDDIRKRQKVAETKEQADADEKALIERMKNYEATARHPKKATLFFDFVNMCDEPDVPEEVEDKATWFRMHYWDKLFESAKLKVESEKRALMYSPQLFNKMNYFFYGMLYHADSDTICREIDRLAARIGNDTALLRYVFDHIEPRYFRSTRNIGWDAVWCHLAGEYYLKGRCPWATEGTLHNIRYNYNRIKQSLIGAHGQELLMLDTTQIDAPEHWKSSHQFPTKYVILWFWDPDCHHCQAQSAELKVLYDSLQTAPDRRFEVYAVGYESDVAKWKNYVKEHDFRWVNVGGQNVNIDYQEAYNVHGAPTMIILNEKRDIIMNKVLPIKGLLQFLDNYEKTRK